MFRVSCKRNKHIQDVRYINDVSCLLFCQSFFQKQGLMKSHRASRMDDAFSAGKIMIEFAASGLVAQAFAVWRITDKNTIFRFKI